ncbi:aspartyl protease family protein 2-like [Solanum pennellii]|uniref:Aspartyl protease family protein 2-like n=1 Tax=Solanum pennellii TaxID=28526 RepID=A0ABM1H6X6_SOLPN|nr:aspartyl protease family protein 2-like [Solanum pennellii]
MQARKRFMSLDPTKLPDPPMPSYTFTVYHRDVFEKSKFKDYDSLLDNRLARCHARASYLASILESQNGAIRGEVLELVPKSTDAFYRNGEYVATFLIGTQMIKNYLLIDTGSDLVWWQCGPCVACYKQDQPLYDSTASKTFRIIGCDKYSLRCRTVDPAFQCNQENFECRYDLVYGDHVQTKGFIADDLITFNLDDHRTIRITFGCSKDQTGEKNFSAFSAGILGLGRGDGQYSLPSQFGGHIMSMCLPTFNSGKPSILSFHTSKWPRATSAKLLFNYRYPIFYYVNIYKVFVNDREVPVSPSWWKFTSDMNGGMIVDTGTTFTRLPHDFYVVFRYIYRAEVEDIPMVEDPGNIFDTCYKEDPSGRNLYFPVVKLYFGSVNSSTMLLLTQERVIVNYRGVYCLAFVGWDSDLSILGMTQLQGVGLTFDSSTSTLSFDIDACD